MKREDGLQKPRLISAWKAFPRLWHKHKMCCQQRSFSFSLWKIYIIYQNIWSCQVLTDKTMWVAKKAASKKTQSHLISNKIALTTMRQTQYHSRGDIVRHSLNNHDNFTYCALYIAICQITVSVNALCNVARGEWWDIHYEFKRSWMAWMFHGNKLIWIIHDLHNIFESSQVIIRHWPSCGPSNVRRGKLPHPSFYCHR